MYETKTVSMPEIAENELEVVKGASTEYPLLECTMNGKTLQSIVKHVCTLSDEAKVKITSEGWEIQQVDPAHISMLNLVVNMQSFERWHYDGFQGIDPITEKEHPNEVGLDFEKIQEFLKTLGASELKKSLTLRLTDKKLIIETGVGTREFSLIDASGMSDHKQPELSDKLQSVFTIRSEDMSRLKTFFKGADKIGDHIELSTGEAIRTDNEPGVRVAAEGDADKTYIVLPVWLNDGKSENARSMFPLDYLDKIVQTLAQQKVSVIVGLGTDYPIRLECRGEKGAFGLEVTYLLAPRIEDSD